MTRMTIATEGEILGVGYMIEPGALHWAEEDGIAVTWQGNYNMILGKAVDFAREGNLITADIQINPLVEIARRVRSGDQHPFPLRQPV